ncbi:MAG: LysM peptidoglycan-binding domain-containing protein [Deltaproteobacteria bacterium]|nr:LysM peptidoglycan-binding domain-containing protein [Deltaproteobacteria bacterium]
MRKFVVTAVIIASACGVFGGREIRAEEATSHAVQKGDTLWDLSGGYLNDPLLWPKIWKINPGIANPHWIRPGQTVKIPGMKKKALVREASADRVVGPVESGSSALARAGLASSSEPLPIVVVKKDLPLSGARAKAVQMIDPAQYYDRGIGMLTNEIPNEGKVLGTEQGWQSAALGEIILISAPGAQVGQQFGVYRDMGKVESLGYFSASPGHLLADIAVVEVVALEASRQQAVIRRAYAEVRTDDVLGPLPERPTVSVRSAPAASVKGAVVAFQFMRQLAGPDDIVYLNIGADQGLAPGDLLSVAAADKAEGRNSGEIMILRVSPTTAAAVVTKRSGHEVRRGDVVGPPVL